MLIIKRCIKNGASAYLTKLAEMDELIEAITKVYNGERYLCKNVFHNLMDDMMNNEFKSKQSNILANLTKREKEILKLIFEELTTKKISDKLHISERTVETHRKNILHKLVLDINIL